MTAIAAVPAGIHPQSAGGRDRAVDLVRAACILCVVVLHSLMVGVSVTPSGPSFVNAAEGHSWLVPISWVLQVMPLFFVIGGFSGATALRRMRARGQDATAFVAGRMHRLLLPAAVTIGSVGAGLAVLASIGVPADLVQIAGYRYGQPLWFLGVFLLCQTLLPVLLRWHDRRPVRTIAVLIAAALAVDVVRAATGIEGIGFLNLAFVWLALQQGGFFLADGVVDRLSVRTRAIAAAGAAAALAVAFLTGAYSPDLVANINPPTTALLLVGVVHTALFSIFRAPLARWAERPAAAGFTRFVSARAMTVYLWHMPVLLTLAGLLALSAMIGGFALPEPSGPAWWVSRPLWLVVALTCTVLVAVPLARFESRPMPQPTDHRGRLAAAVVTGISGVVLLLIVGTTPGTAVIAVAALVGALRLSRAPHALAVVTQTGRDAAS